jgi:hypothetical protein
MDATLKSLVTSAVAWVIVGVASAMLQATPILAGPIEPIPIVQVIKVTKLQQDDYEVTYQLSNPTRADFCFLTWWREPKDILFGSLILEDGRGKAVAQIGDDSGIRPAPSQPMFTVRVQAGTGLRFRQSFGTLPKPGLFLRISGHGFLCSSLERVTHERTFPFLQVIPDLGIPVHMATEASMRVASAPVRIPR